MTISKVPPLVALVAETNHVSASDLALIAASLQKQVVRDFSPAWGVTASVSAFPTLNTVPLGYWKILIRDNIGAPGAAGFHTDQWGQPLALVQWSGTVEETCITCSHELLEMLADPWGSRLVVGSVPFANGTVQRARVLVEVCDPSEAYYYEVDGLPVSDFVTPRYYGPHHWGRAHPNAYRDHLSFMDVIDAPMTIARGGYLSYVVPSGEWWQTTWFGGAQPMYRDIGRRLAELKEPQGSLRAAIDRITQADASQFVTQLAHPVS